MLVVSICSWPSHRRDHGDVVACEQQAHGGRYAGGCEWSRAWPAGTGTCRPRRPGGVSGADLRAPTAADRLSPARPRHDDQVISPRRALRELGRIRRVTLSGAERTIERDTRHSALQDRILAAFGV